MPSQSVELQKQTKTKFIDKENRLMVSESGNGSTVKCIKEVERYKITVINKSKEYTVAVTIVISYCVFENCWVNLKSPCHEEKRFCNYVWRWLLIILIMVIILPYTLIPNHEKKLEDKYNSNKKIKMRHFLIYVICTHTWQYRTGVDRGLLSLVLLKSHAKEWVYWLWSTRGQQPRNTGSRGGQAHTDITGCIQPARSSWANYSSIWVLDSAFWKQK